MTSQPIPPFPSSVPTAPLIEISLSKLQRHDVAEEDRLWEAACELGFFYLDLRSDVGGHDQLGQKGHRENGEANRTSERVDGEKLLADADLLFGVADELFNRPLEEKQKYDFAKEGSYFGYKGYGAGVIDASGTRDRNEFYNVSKDAILHFSPDPLPSMPMLDAHETLLESFIRATHRISVDVVLSTLNGRLGLPMGRLHELHRLDANSGDQVRFVKAPPQPAEDSRTALGAHTDFGSVTVLFARVGGLQVLLPGDGAEEENWAYVRPLPGRAIINLGDALVKFSAGILRSNVHRVVAPPGEQAGLTKFSLVYFCRPIDEALLRALDGSPAVRERIQNGDWQEDEAVTSKEWILRRALGRRGMRKWDDATGTKGYVV